PDPNSALEFEPALLDFYRKIRQSLPCNLFKPKISPVKTSKYLYKQLPVFVNKLSSSTVFQLRSNIRAATKKYTKELIFLQDKTPTLRRGSEDRRRPGGGFLCTSTAWGRKTFENISVTQSQPKPQTGRIQGP
ncbi:hypothetical protein Prudu_019259, partial [Prunus dulcis]